MNTEDKKPSEKVKSEKADIHRQNNFLEKIPSHVITAFRTFDGLPTEEQIKEAINFANKITLMKCSQNVKNLDKDNLCIKTDEDNEVNVTDDQNENGIIVVHGGKGLSLPAGTYKKIQLTPSDCCFFQDFEGDGIGIGIGTTQAAAEAAAKQSAKDDAQAKIDSYVVVCPDPNCPVPKKMESIQPSQLVPPTVLVIILIPLDDGSVRIIWFWIAVATAHFQMPYGCFKQNEDGNVA